jgi:hypothetical protein
MRAAAAVAIALTTLPAAAIAADGSRQTASIVFDGQRPGQSTGTQLSIDYVNPDDAAAKPPAVKTVVIKLAPGSAIDTSIPARCEASDEQLMATGPAACPAASRVGTGELDADTGLAGPARLLQNDVTVLNNKSELILLLESKAQPTTRLVARASIQGATLTSEVPPLPGGPPDGFTAIKRVRLRLDPRPGYVTTPASCPSSGQWTNSISFTYRDDVTQSRSNASACTGSGGGPGVRRDYKAPRIRVGGVPSRTCAGPVVRARVRIGERWSGLQSARLLLDGRGKLTTTRKAFRRRIRTARLHSGGHRLTVVAVDRAGNRSVKRVGFRKCAG